MFNFIDTLERVITGTDEGDIFVEFAGRLLEVKPAAITGDTVIVRISKDQLDGPQEALAGEYTLPITRFLVRNHRTSRP